MRTFGVCKSGGKFRDDETGSPNNRLSFPVCPDADDGVYGR